MNREETKKALRKKEIEEQRKQYEEKIRLANDILAVFMPKMNQMLFSASDVASLINLVKKITK